MPRFITEIKRTHTCGELTKADIGKEVVLFGWVDNRRDHGGAVFIDLRDREGVTQVVFEQDVRPEVHELAGQLRLEYCVGIRGKVVSRGGNVNPKLPTGEIEVHATELEIFNRSEPRRSRSRTRSTRARRSGSSTATSTCAGRRCRRRS